MIVRAFLDNLYEGNIPITENFIEKVLFQWNTREYSELIDYITSYIKKYYSNDKEKNNVLFMKFYLNLKSEKRLEIINLDLLINSIVDYKINYPLEDRSEWLRGIAKLDPLLAIKLFEEEVYPNLRSNLKVKRFVEVLCFDVVEQLDVKLYPKEFLSCIYKVVNALGKTFRKFNDLDKKYGASYLEGIVIKLINSNYEKVAMDMMDKHSQNFPLPNRYILVDAITQKLLENQNQFTDKEILLELLIETKKEYVKQHKHMEAFPLKW